jgi:hypothetical protein
MSVSTTYPNVPVASGVPPVPRDPNPSTSSGYNNSTAAAPVPLTADAISTAHSAAGPKWGIFSLAGAAIVVGDSARSVDFRREWRVSDYPVEQGAFASYDKLAQPYDFRIVFMQGGTEAQRSAFLTAVDAAAASLALINAVTPEATYLSMNIIHYDYRREARAGATLLAVEVWLEQIRVVAAAAFASTAAIDGASPRNGGTQQPTGVQPIVVTATTRPTDNDVLQGVAQPLVTSPSGTAATPQPWYQSAFNPGA